MWSQAWAYGRVLGGGCFLMSEVLLFPHMPTMWPWA